MTRVSTAQQEHPSPAFDDHWDERVDLAAAFRSAARLNLHEGVANHFSVAVNQDGTQFLINPNQSHFSRIRASELLLLDANDPGTMDKPNAPDSTAWGLHGALHRQCPHARVALHVHSIHATVLATLEDPVSLQSIRTAQCFLIATRLIPNTAGLRLKRRLSAAANILQIPPRQY